MKEFRAPTSRRLSTGLCSGIATAILFFLPAAGDSQQQHTLTIPPVAGLNAQYVQGVAPGYFPSAGLGLTLNIAPGTTYCGGAVINYAGGSLTMAPNATNYIYLDTSASCAPAANTAGFGPASIPLAVAATDSSSITSITDDRTWFSTGVSSIFGSLGIGIPYPSEKLEVARGNIRVDNGYFYALGVGIPQMLLNGPGAYFGNVQNDQAGTWSLGYTPTPSPVLGKPVLSWTSASRVGIGNVISPAQTLDVNGSGRFAVNTVSFSSTPAFDASLGNTQQITLAGDVTSSTLVNASAGEFLYFIICQDAGGNRTFAWPANVRGGMTIGTTASTCSAQAFVFSGTYAYALTPGVANQ
jgi:hypothetical protein